jgi:hypothetical protein
MATKTGRPATNPQIPIGRNAYLLQPGDVVPAGFGAVCWDRGADAPLTKSGKTHGLSTTFGFQGTDPTSGEKCSLNVTLPKGE